MSAVSYITNCSKPKSRLYKTKGSNPKRRCCEWGSILKKWICTYSDKSKLSK